MRIGTDIVEIRRISLSESFLKGVLSPNELLLLAKSVDKPSFVAGRFAAKEAFLKAMGTGLSGPRMSALDVVYGEKGSPELVYEGRRYAVSIAHDGGYATAVALIEE
ncbi:MAG: holo-ACP synthase [Bacilli bacterium]|jgi:phosphopantetheine--protein transferase-like protein|nr:holo-ACP synthase [Bacilli bacterium]